MTNENSSNHTGQDADNFYHYDEHGRLTGKDERQLRPQGSHSHHYGYDNRHRLVHYRRMQQGDVLKESRYIYDPLGRRVGKQVWKSQVEHETFSGKEYIWLNPEPKVTWYGWDGDRQSTAQTAETRIQTLYSPGSFTPLLRIETATEELAKAVRRTLAEKLQQDGGGVFPPELVAMLDNLERELNAGKISEHSLQWLAGCGLTPEQMKNQMEPMYTPQRKLHLYHCDHRGLPLALIDADGKIAWRAEFDEWGNVLQEDNPDNLQQLIRLPGQQYDQETGLYYNRHRYYDPQLGRYITQDPIGLRGGWNFYLYPLNPIVEIDLWGLDAIQINYDYYPVNTGLGFNLPLGHGAVVTVEPKTGKTKYYEFGRYADKECGNVRVRRVPNLSIDKDRLPTKESLDKLYKFTSENYGHNSTVTPTYYSDTDYNKANKYAEDFSKSHECYSLTDNNCKTFAQDAATAGTE